MNCKAYGISFAAVFLAFGLLTGCGGSSSTTTPPPPPPPTTSNFVFSVSGQDGLPADSGDINYYALAGVVTINTSTGAVTTGEQDYNDGDGTTSPQGGGDSISGDSISGGTLTVSSSTGQGTLTLNTSNTALGVSGVETFAVQFVNANHALITQFDGSATSSGSLDLQSLSTAPSGGFAFTVSGVDPGYDPIAVGGVFTYATTTPTSANGAIDLNDDGTIQTNQPFTITFNAPDASGRGTITSSAQYDIDGTETAIAFNYYIVGPEAIRIIDVDTTDAAIGSAFGQGTNATAAGSTTFVDPTSSQAVFSVAGNPWTFGNGAVGMFTATAGAAGAGTFAGVGEDFEVNNGISSGLEASLAGTYTMGANGYGTPLAFTTDFGDTTTWGLYATDPNLNLEDPNNTTGGGGALVLDLSQSTDVLPGTTGVIIPQTDSATAATDFNGNYAAGWQNFNYYQNGCGGCETDMVSQGSMVSAGALSLTGDDSDPFATLTATTLTTGDTFAGTPQADTINLGRYSMLTTNSDPLAVTINAATPASGEFDLVMYQAGANQLFWLELDEGSTFSGPLEQQPSTLTGLPGASIRPSAQIKHK